MLFLRTRFRKARLRKSVRLMPRLHLGRGGQEILSLRHERCRETDLSGLLKLQFSLLQHLQVKNGKPAVSADLAIHYLRTVDLRISI